VEDDHDLRDLLEVLLTSKGLDVTTMETGEALLNYLATHESPKLVLVDLALPFMSGNELIPILNKRTDRNQYKVIIASGWDDLPSRAKILKADGYLKKPYNPQTIGDSIKKLLPGDSTSSKQNATL
jgi:DNA-binding response OmpR family regulator